MYTLADFVRLNARRFPDRLAVVDDSDRLTHAELSARAHALARGLEAAGIGPGDRVGVLSGNRIFAVETLLGVALAGAVYVPFNWRWARDELVAGLNLIQPRIVLVADDFIDALEAALTGPDTNRGIDVRRQGTEYESLLLEPVAAVVDGFSRGANTRRAVRPEDPLCILFTGGTTGQSKGVVISHGAAMINALNELVDLGFGQAPDGRLGTGPVVDHSTGLSVTPLFHSAALLCVFLPHYVAGGTNVLLAKFDEAQWGEVVAREAVTSTFIIPNMIRRLTKAGSFDHPGVQATLRQMHTGGGLLRMPDKEEVLRKLPHLQLFYRYGLTEAGPMLTRLHHRDILDPTLDGSIGQEYTFAEVQLQDPVTGEEVPPGQIGEICSRGPGVMTEYYARPDATAEVMRDGWLHTGDLAVRDERGYFFFRDRAKDMIKSGGENVYAAEIEQLLYAHPAVMECGVVGVPSAEWDEEVRAVVALRTGQAATADELAAYLRQHLAGYKIPKEFRFVDAHLMPVNTSGKVVKAGLRQLVGW